MEYLERRRRRSTEKNNAATDPSEISSAVAAKPGLLFKKEATTSAKPKETLKTSTATNLILHCKAASHMKKILIHLNLKRMAKTDYLLE